MLEQPGYLEIPKCENSPVRSISREVDLAWVAGILDGEGALSVALKTTGKRQYLDAKVRVYNTDVLMIKKLSQIYMDLGVGFFYNLNKKRMEHYKNQLGICVGTQGSCHKLLVAVKPYLSNKREYAEAMIRVIEFVKSLPRAGATWSNDYAEKPAFIKLMAECVSVKKVHIDPSTTTRKAGEELAW